jgi:hypothetical protein
MNYQNIKNEIESHPETYSGKTPREIAALLNTQSTQVLQERWVSARTLYNELDDAEDILTRLETAADDPALPETIRRMLRRVLGWLDNPTGSYPGIDVGAARTQMLIASLVGILTSDQVAELQSLGYATVSLAESLCGEHVGEWHITQVLAMEASETWNAE